MEAVGRLTAESRTTSTTATVIRSSVDLLRRPASPREAGPLSRRHRRNRRARGPVDRAIARLRPPPAASERDFHGGRADRRAEADPRYHPRLADPARARRRRRIRRDRRRSQPVRNRSAQHGDQRPRRDAERRVLRIAARREGPISPLRSATAAGHGFDTLADFRALLHDQEGGKGTASASPRSTASPAIGGDVAVEAGRQGTTFTLYCPRQIRRRRP